MITKSSLINIGFSEVDGGEYSNGIVTIFLLGDNVVSLMSESSDDGLLCVPWFECKSIDALVKFLKATKTYGVQG